MTRRVLAIYGTRPEAIKMAPLVRGLRDHASFEVLTAVTAQHREMLDQVNTLFDIQPDHDLDLMVHGASLADLSSRALSRLSELVDSTAPSAVVVQGDTSTAFIAALAAFYARVPVIHLEAGLRTGDLASPFPEEGNRQLVGRLAALHLAPTATSRANLMAEGIKPEQIAVTGNTVIDALNDAVGRPVTFSDPTVAAALRLYPRFALVTTHRRESWGAPMREAMTAVRELALLHPDFGWILPMHRNPVVREVVEPALGDLSNATLVEPLSYHEFCHVMEKSHLLLTDSGGVQEEAPSLGKPVLVMRDTTERPEALAAGTVRLVGTSADAIRSSVVELLDDPVTYDAMATAVNPYGDGRAASRAVAAIAELFGVGERLPDFEPSDREPGHV